MKISDKNITKNKTKQNKNKNPKQNKQTKNHFTLVLQQQEMFIFYFALFW